jgi:hypothetical protein
MQRVVRSLWARHLAAIIPLSFGFSRPNACPCAHPHAS